MSTIKDLYPQFFPKRNPNPVWNTHAEQIEQRLYKLNNENNYLDLFILAIKGQIEFLSKKRDVADHSFVVWILATEYVELIEKHPDIRYIMALLRVRYPQQWDISFFVEVLQCLTSIQRNDNSYTPMSAGTKSKIRNLFYNRVLMEQTHIDIYHQIIGEDDDQYCKQDKENSCNN